GLSTIVLAQGAAAYHFGYTARTFVIDRSTRGDDDPPSATDDEEDPGAVDEAVIEDVRDEDEQPDSRRIRGLGMMHDPNDLATGMVVALGLAAGAWRGGRRPRDLLLAAAAGALVYGIYLTHSRGGAGPLGVVVMLWRFAAGRAGRLPALLLLAALAAGVSAVDFGGRSLSMEPDESASGRLEAWTEGLEMLKEQPMLGVGYGQFEDHHTLTAHNSLVLCFAETGLLGCFFWVALFVVTLLELRRLKNLPDQEPFDDDVRRWAGALQLSLVGFMAAAFFLSRTFAPILYLVLGLCAALAAIARNEGRSVALPALPELGMLVLASELG